MFGLFKNKWIRLFDKLADGHISLNKELNKFNSDLSLESRKELIVEMKKVEQSLSNMKAVLKRELNK